MTTASGARNALPAVFAITFAKATALSSAAPLGVLVDPGATEDADELVGAGSTQKSAPRPPTSRSRSQALRRPQRHQRHASCCSFRHVSDLARGRLGRREQVG